MDTNQPPSFAKTAQSITARVLAESRRSYGTVVEESILIEWVSITLGTLLTETTRVTTFIPLLAMRDIREMAEQFQRAEAA